MRRLLWTLPGLTLVVVGVVLVATTGADLNHVGWFAYTPLAAQDYAGATVIHGGTLVSWAQVLGAVLVALGLALLTAYAGFRLGRRRAA